MLNKCFLIQIISIIIAISNNLFAENKSVNYSISTNNTEDSLYYDVFLKYRLENVDSALKYAKLSLDESLNKEDNELTLKSLNAIGYCYQKMSLLDSALFIYKKGVSKSRLSGNNEREMYFANSIGILYDDIGKYDSAISYFYSSLELARILGRDKDISVALTNIGNINFDLGDSESAIKFYTQSAEIKERNEYPGLEIVYQNIGLCYDELGDHASAISYFNKVLQICELGNCNQYYVDKGLLGLGMSYFGLGVFEIAEEYINQVKDSEDNLTRIIAYRYLSELSFKRENYRKAIDYIDESNRLAQSISSPESLKINYLLKSEIMDALGKPDSSLLYFKLHHNLKDSLFNENVAKSIQELFVGIERQQADEEIQVREREIAIRKTANTLLILVVILSAVLIIRIVIDLSRRKRINKFLDKQIAKKTAELTKSYKTLSEKSRDLDNLIYNISHEIRGPLARLLGLINIGKIETKDQPDTIKYYNELRNEAVDLERILKRMIIINNVNHHEVHKVKVDPQYFFDQLLDNSKYLWQDKIRIDLNMDGIQTIKTDTDLLEIALQNMIDNAVRFRNTNGDSEPLLNISLSKSKEGKIDINLEDNGEGFDEKFAESLTDLFFVASEKGGKGMGLHHTKLALNKIGAEFEILSTRNPTTFVIHL